MALITLFVTIAMSVTSVFSWFTSFVVPRQASTGLNIISTQDLTLVATFVQGEVLLDYLSFKNIVPNDTIEIELNITISSISYINYMVCFSEFTYDLVLPDESIHPTINLLNVFALDDMCLLHYFENDEVRFAEGSVISGTTNTISFTIKFLNEIRDVDNNILTNTGLTINDFQDQIFNIGILKIIQLL